jgi:branched-chain amino acid aminotransferase
MQTEYFSHNGQVRPINVAIIPLGNIEYSYGFGVYETIRVLHGIIYFLQEHLIRLFESAAMIGLEHEFGVGGIEDHIHVLLTANKLEDCNIKMLLIGGRTAKQSNLYILTLNPLYPDRKLYRDGAHLVTYNYERFLPHAKTLNMLPSYLAYKQASKAGAYDALLIDRSNCITEGSRTNFFALKSRTIISPPESKILLGVMRSVVLQVAKSLQISIVERDIALDELAFFDAAFLTSTSSKVMPIRSIDDSILPAMPEILRSLMGGLDMFLKNCNGRMQD